MIDNSTTENTVRVGAVKLCCTRSSERRRCRASVELAVTISISFSSFLAANLSSWVLDALAISEDENAVLQLREHLPTLGEIPEEESSQRGLSGNERRAESPSLEVGVKAFVVLTKALDGDVDLAEDLLRVK